MHRIALCIVLFLALAPPASTQMACAGDFDYYVLSLGWSPNWCARTGDARGSDQCDPRHDHGWILHGLWPQYAQGIPRGARAPSARPPAP